MNQPTNYQEEVKRVADRIDDALIHAVARMDENSDVNLDNVIIALAEARAYIVGLSIRLIAVDRLLISIPGDGPRIYADELTVGERAHQAALESSKLPKLQPQGHPKPVGGKGRARGWQKGTKYKPGVAAKLKSPKDFDCPTCHAESGTNCFKFEGPGINKKLLDERNDGSFFHIQRATLSRAANDRIRKDHIQS